jgi:DNA polymerase
MATYHIDLETRSRADLKRVGAHRYARDASTAILCIAVAKDDHDPRLWVPREFRHLVDHDPIAEELLFEISFDKEAVVYSHNAGFEISVLDALMEKTTGFKPPAHHQWRCTAAMGRRAALPASLEKLAETLNLKNLKDSKGKGLIRKFSVPQKTRKSRLTGTSSIDPIYGFSVPDVQYDPAVIGGFIEPSDEPEAFKEFCDYCIQDVRVEQEIHKTLKDFELTGFPLRTFLLDLEINCRGFPVNLDALRKAEKLVNEETEALAEEFRKLTGFEHTQRDRVVEWLQQNGFKHDNLRADTLEEIFEDEEFDDSTPLGRALTLKKRVSYASLKKIPAMLGCAGPQDNRVRGTLVYHGAGTGRWSASLVQPQNFKRPAEYLKKLTGKAYDDIIAGCNRGCLNLVYGPPLEVVSSCIRHFIQDKGPMLDADYAAIEARIIAWQAQEKWRLDVFKTHGKIYEASASMMFKVPFSEFEAYEARGEKHPLRHKGKTAELACGFGGGVGALERMGALKNGLTKEELPDIISQWREANPAVVVHWRTTEDAAKNAIRNPGKVYPFGVNCGFFRTKTAGMDYLFMRLPSGRKLAYPQPQLTPQIVWKEEKTQLVDGLDEEGKPIQIRKVISSEQKKLFNPTPEQIAKVKQKHPKARMSEAITFFGQIPMKAMWGRVATYGGSLVENATQAIAADFMAHGAINASRAGYKIVALIHDEALSEYDPLAGQSADHFVQCLTKLPPWAEGMPLAAEGGVVEFYLK